VAVVGERQLLAAWLKREDATWSSAFRVWEVEGQAACTVEPPEEEHRHALDRKQVDFARHHAEEQKCHPQSTIFASF